MSSEKINDELSTSIKLSHLSSMTRGWFIGDFFPVAHSTKDVEVAVQCFPAGYESSLHHHKIATEVTLLLSGKAMMAGYQLCAGDILTLPPGTSSKFVALDDCVTVVVKLPGCLNDKYEDEAAIVC